MGSPDWALAYAALAHTYQFLGTAKGEEYFLPRLMRPDSLDVKTQFGMQLVGQFARRTAVSGSTSTVEFTAIGSRYAAQGDPGWYRKTVIND